MSVVFITISDNWFDLWEWVSFTGPKIKAIVFDFLVCLNLSSLLCNLQSLRIKDFFLPLLVEIVFS